MPRRWRPRTVTVPRPDPEPDPKPAPKPKPDPTPAAPAPAALGGEGWGNYEPALGVQRHRDGDPDPIPADPVPAAPAAAVDVAVDAAPVVTPELQPAPSWQMILGAPIADACRSLRNCGCTLLVTDGCLDARGPLSAAPALRALRRRSREVVAYLVEHPELAEPPAA
jgi:hypothetical protein